MSLIPLLLGRLSAAPTPVVASAGRYNPGTGHRPVAAAVAVGLPVALLVAVALSPFEMPKLFTPSGPIIIRTIPVDPLPPPDPTSDPQEPTKSVITTLPTPLPPIAQDPVRLDPQVDPMPRKPDPEIGSEPIKPVQVLQQVPIPLVPADFDKRFKASFQPDYPASEQRREIEGFSRVRVLVGTDGRVKTVEDVRTTSPGFFEETRRRALAKWRFNPATRGGLAEESWFTITVSFQLTS